MKFIYLIVVKIYFQNTILNYFYLKNKIDI